MNIANWLHDQARCHPQRPALFHGAEQVAAIREASGDKIVKLICGNTSSGPWGVDDTSQVFVDISAVPELAGISMTEGGLVAGASA